MGLLVEVYPFNYFNTDQGVACFDCFLFPFFLLVCLVLILCNDEDFSPEHSMCYLFYSLKGENPLSHISSSFVLRRL